MSEDNDLKAFEAHAEAAIQAAFRITERHILSDAGRCRPDLKGMAMRHTLLAAQNAALAFAEAARLTQERA